MTKFLALLLGAFHAACALHLSAVPMPPLISPISGHGVVLEGEGPATVWDANLQPFSVDNSGLSKCADAL